MIVRLMIVMLTFCLVLSSSVQAQVDSTDPGILDTVALSFMVNADTTKATLELFVYSDSLVKGATIGMDWDNSNLQMDSAVATPLVDSAFDLAVVLYRFGDIDSSNSYLEFKFAGALLFSGGLAGDDAGRRHWATYYFSINDWAGISSDGMIFDSVEWIPGGRLQFTTARGGGEALYVPRWEGALVFGNPSDVTEIHGDLPQTYTLEQNYPNPFNPTTEIVFELPRRSWVKLTVFNVLGQVVETLVDQELSASRYVATWDGSGVSSGVYFYRLESDDFNETRKMILVK